MAPVDFSQAQAEGKGFQFPGEFEITAMGPAGSGLEEQIPALLEERQPVGEIPFWDGAAGVRAADVLRAF